MLNKFNHYMKFAFERIRISLKTAMEFKFDFITTILSETVFMIFSYFLAHIFTSAVPNFGLTATQFFIYSQTLDIIFTINISMRSSIVDNIRQGQLNLDLIRPLNIIWVQFWNNFGTRRILVQIMKIIFMIIYISINSTINPLIYFIVLIFISLFSLAITTGFFYLVRAYDLKKLEAGTFLHRISNENNLENYIITYPIYLLPKFILVYGTFFGFYYVANVTLGLIYGQSITYIILLLLTELILAIILIFFANLAWKKMLKYYEGFGG